MYNGKIHKQHCILTYLCCKSLLKTISDKSSYFIKVLYNSPFRWLAAIMLAGRISQEKLLHICIQPNKAKTSAVSSSYLGWLYPLASQCLCKFTCVGVIVSPLNKFTSRLSWAFSKFLLSIRKLRWRISTRFTLRKALCTSIR